MLFFQNTKSVLHKLLWRNRLARSAVNRKVGGSSPPRGVRYVLFFWVYFLVATGFRLLYFPPAKSSFCGVVVITFALHAKGLRFDPGQKQETFYLTTQRNVQRVLVASASWFIFRSSQPLLRQSKATIFINRFCGVAVITFASHAKGPRFDPGQKHF